MAKIDFKSKYEKAEKTITNLVLRKHKQPVYITFNFSFLTNNSTFNLTNENFSVEHQQLFLSRIMEISNRDIVSITANSSKKQGLEKITEFNKRDKILSMELHEKFVNSKRLELCGKGFWIFRLCPNNNPYETRIIGKMNDDIFYVMFIDVNHDLYAKRK